jgi:hypothetical protein
LSKQDCKIEFFVMPGLRTIAVPPRIFGGGQSLRLTFARAGWKDSILFGQEYVNLPNVPGTSVAWIFQIKRTAKNSCQPVVVETNFVA